MEMAMWGFVVAIRFPFHDEVESYISYAKGTTASARIGLWPWSWDVMLMCRLFRFMRVRASILIKN